MFTNREALKSDSFQLQDSHYIIPVLVDTI